MQEMQSPTCALPWHWHLTARQCASIPCTSVNWVTAMWNSWVLGPMDNGPGFMPPVSSDLSPVEYRVQGINGKIVCIRHQFKHDWLETVLDWPLKWLVIKLCQQCHWLNGIRDFRPICKKGGYLNTSCNILDLVDKDFVEKSGWLSGLRSAKNTNQIWRTRLLLLWPSHLEHSSFWSPRY